MYRTYFDKDSGTYLGAYDGPDEDNPHEGHPSLAGQVGNAFDTFDFKKGTLIKGAIAIAPKTIEQRIAACESALGITP
ncbi:MAG: hypothetical protein AAB262_11935 [Elusimicrobiota bacterium]